MSHVPPGKEIDLGGKYGVKSCESLRQAFAAYVKTSVEDGDLKDIMANYVNATHSCFLVAELISEVEVAAGAAGTAGLDDAESKQVAAAPKVVGCVALQPKSVSGTHFFWL